MGWGYRLLHIGFTVMPILSGLDKFSNVMTGWTMYMSPVLMRSLPVSPNLFMRAVGVVEIIAGIIVAVKPRIGGFVVAAWLLVIIINLLSIPGFYDIALRDLGLLFGALALALLSKKGCCK